MRFITELILVNYKLMSSNTRSQNYLKRHQEKNREKFNNSSDLENIDRSTNTCIL